MFAFVREGCSSGGAASEDASLCPFAGNAAQYMPARMHPFAEALAKHPRMPCFPHAARATAHGAPVDLLCTLPFARAGTAPCDGCVTFVWLLYFHAPALASVLTSPAFVVFQDTPSTVCPWRSTRSIVFLVLAASRPCVAVQPHSSHRPTPSYNTRRHYTLPGYRAAIIRTNP
jgi:hypothetical protein